MTTLEVTRLVGDRAAVDEAAVQSFASKLKGQLLRDGDGAYDECRQIWNAMIDRRPALIARCETTQDVVAAVNFAREHDLLVAIRGGGHNIAGNAICDGGLMIDLSPMKTVRVDAQARRANVGPGATLGDVDGETQKHGLATPTGINSTTGIAGLTLGGGFGWLSRKLGMTVDNLISAEVVTADGNVVTASEHENPDLFWALRGGGGNFGVVTNFEFQLHPVGPEVFAGLVVYPFEQAKSLLRQYDDFYNTLPDEATVWEVSRLAPPLPFLPENVHGKPVVVLACFYAGDNPEQGAKLFEPVRSFGDPYGEHLGAMPYTAWQQGFDPLLTPGARNYWKSHNLNELSDGMIGVLIEYINKVPGPQCEIFLGGVGGATTRVAPDATAYAHRDAKYIMNVHGRWDSPDEDAAGMSWARDFFQASREHASGSVYVNFIPEDEPDRIREAYGPNYDRLVQVKRKHDPNNMFRMNQNIKP